MTSAGIHFCVLFLLTLLVTRPAIYGVQSGRSSMEIDVVGAVATASSSQKQEANPSEGEKNPDATAESSIQDLPQAQENAIFASTSSILPTQPKIAPSAAIHPSASLPSPEAGSYFKSSRKSSAASAPSQGSDSLKPSFLRNPPPTYPESARRAGQEGLVTLRVAVNENGEVDSVKIETSSGYQILDSAAMRAVKNWKFRPSEVSGIPIRSELAIPIRFRLTESSI